MSEGLENEKQTHLFRSTVFESRAAGVNVWMTTWMIEQTMGDVTSSCLPNRRFYAKG